MGITFKWHILTFYQYLFGSGESLRFFSKFKVSLKQLFNSGRADGRTVDWSDGRTVGRSDSRTGGRADERSDGRSDGRSYGRTAKVA